MGPRSRQVISSSVAASSDQHLQHSLHAPRFGRGRTKRSLGGLFLPTLAAALLPVGLMIAQPTLMFERGWVQFAGVSVYWFGLALLGRILWRLRAEEAGFQRADAWEQAADLSDVARSIEPDDPSELARRLRQLAFTHLVPATSHTPRRDAPDTSSPDPIVIPGLAASNIPQTVPASRDSAATITRPSLGQLIELNREASALDQERAAGHFALPRYALYLLPVIGFIGTVEGISIALFRMSEVLPTVNDLDGFLAKLAGVTSALQIAFDSTLLALFLSAPLMFVSTLIQRRSEENLARIDQWIVENALPRLGGTDEASAGLSDGLARLERAIERQSHAHLATLEALGSGLAPQTERLADAVARLGPGLERFETAARQLATLHDDLHGLVGLIHQSVALHRADHTERVEALERLRLTTERTAQGVESLAGSLAESFAESTLSAQRQLETTLAGLRETLEMLHVSMDQGHVLYRSIVKKITPGHLVGGIPGREDAA